MEVANSLPNHLIILCLVLLLYFNIVCVCVVLLPHIGFYIISSMTCPDFTKFDVSMFNGTNYRIMVCGN